MTDALSYDGVTGTREPAGPRIRESGAPLWQPRLILGGVSIAAISWIGLRLHLNMASVGTLELLVVVLVALYSGLWQASVLSLAAIASLDYFFIPPLFSLEIADPQSWISLATFECTALIVSRLSHAAKAQAFNAEQRRRDVERLYEVCKQIPLPGVKPAGHASEVPELIRREFHLTGIVFFDARSGRFHSAGECSQALEAGCHKAFLTNQDYFDDGQQAWFQCVRIGGRTEGALGLKGDELTGLVAASLASLTALSVEHSRSFERESMAHAARQTEQLRTAVLDALAHEFKSPLTTIRAASSGLLEMRRLTPMQLELVTLIDDEADRLSQLTTKLLRTAMLEGEAVKIRPRSLSVMTMIDSVLAEMRPRLDGRLIKVSHVSPTDSVTADPDLCARALAQLLENARTYSYPDSAIEVSAHSTAEEVVIRVTNQGKPIPQPDQERIFDRFYRSSDVQHHVSGTGIGLSVAKQLIEAQAGRIWVESSSESGTTFYVALPGKG
jgi:two-component system sensor histidine kinase KdpD